VPLLVAGSVLFGLGSGTLASLPPLIAQREFAPADVQRAVALVFGFSQACFAFAPLIFGALCHLAGDDSVMQASIVFVAAGLLQLGSVGALLVGFPRRAPAVAANPM
jgi:MFS family permease